MSLVPVNRMLLINPVLCSSEAGQDSILVPDDYKPTQLHAVGEVLAISNDCKIEVKENDRIVYDNSMVQEIQISGVTSHLLLENYVMAVLKEE